MQHINAFCATSSPILSLGLADALEQKYGRRPMSVSKMQQSASKESLPRMIQERASPVAAEMQLSIASSGDSAPRSPQSDQPQSERSGGDDAGSPSAGKVIAGDCENGEGCYEYPSGARYNTHLLCDSMPLSVCAILIVLRGHLLQIYRRME